MRQVAGAAETDDDPDDAVLEPDVDRAGVDGLADVERLRGVDDAVVAAVEGRPDGEPDPAALAEPPPLEVSARTVTTSRTRTRAAEPMSSRRRRQYTAGGWDPTG